MLLEFQGPSIASSCFQDEDLTSSDFRSRSTVLLPASAVKQYRTVFGNHACMIDLTSGYLHYIQHPDISFESVNSSGRHVVLLMYCTYT